ncbi:hypothetical protein BDZ89DRAFT_489917 [Hymenopellis radicata]|nr:hypothetical protein BDZ89DRAFT_489917 [Hymenopellis radicata]
MQRNLPIMMKSSELEVDCLNRMMIQGLFSAYFFLYDHHQCLSRRRSRHAQPPSPLRTVSSG